MTSSNPSPAPAFLPTPSGSYVVPESLPTGGIEFSLVLPTFKEAQNIQPALRAVCDTLSQVEGLRYEVIVVDDNSPDGTADLALSLSAEMPAIRVIRRTQESGLATAVIRGWQAARGEILAVMDADLQHPPEVLGQLVRAIRNGADLAIGSRHVEEGGVSDWSILRRIVSRTAQMIGLVLLPDVVGRVSDPMSGYFLLKRRTIAGKPLNPTGYKILIEVLGRGTIRSIDEVGYVFRERQEGSSKISTRIYLQYLQHLLRLRFDLLAQSPFIRFCVVGATGYLVDMLLLYWLSDPRSLGFGLTRSKIASAEAAIVNNFLWNDAWTFAPLVGAARSLRSKFRRFLKFNAICTLGLALSVVLLNIQFNWFGLNRYLANTVAIVITMLWNYTFNKRLGWRTTS